MPQPPQKPAKSSSSPEPQVTPNDEAMSDFRAEDAYLLEALGDELAGIDLTDLSNVLDDALDDEARERFR